MHNMTNFMSKLRNQNDLLTNQCGTDRFLVVIVSSITARKGSLLS